METCVLIPSEFSLVLCPNKNSKENHISLERRKGDENVNRLYEMNVCVWSNQYIPKGTFFLPFQGTIRLDRLEVHSLLMKNDVSLIFFSFLFYWLYVIGLLIKVLVSDSMVLFIIILKLQSNYLRCYILLNFRSSFELSSKIT